MRIARRSPSRPIIRGALATAALVLVVAGCSSGGAAASISAGSSAPPASGPGGPSSAAPASASVGGALTAARIDPCKSLTTAEVQPFFSVPIVTALPGPIPGTCEWAANDSPGSVSTSMDVTVVTGQDALDTWSIADGPGTHTEFSGVGDKAEHYPGVTDFVSIKGDILCKMSTVGSAHLAGKMQYDPTAIPDAAATQIAQSFGTLCNRIYGSGSTAPALTAPPLVAGGSASAGPTRSVAVPAVGGTLGKAFPLPTGLDCTGHTTTDNSGAITCEATMTGDQFAVYPFYLSVLPKDGYTINHQTEETGSNGKEAASILFEGNEAGGFSTISIFGSDVTITLQAP